MNAVRKVLGAAPIPGSASAQASTSQAEDDLYGDEEPITKATPAPAPVTSPASAPSPPAPARESARTPTTSPSTAKGKQRADAAPQAGLAASTTTTNSAQKAARDALQKKQREDAEELRRIKARIEQDKAERKAQAEARRSEREQKHTADTATPPRTNPSTRGSQAQTVHLNIRLFDGRTIRSAFPRTATLENEVRKWIDTEFTKLDPADPNVQNRALPPYFFRHILAPQPSRELSAGDENQTLGDIDLAPSATLVLVPVKGYADAYGGSGTNLLAGTSSGIISGAFGLLSSTVGYAGGILGSFLGTGSAPQPSQGQAVGGGSASGGQPGSQRSEREEEAGIRVRTLADQRAREPRSQQFYNGNQVSSRVLHEYFISANHGSRTSNLDQMTGGNAAWYETAKGIVSSRSAAHVIAKIRLRLWETTRNNTL